VLNSALRKRLAHHAKAACKYSGFFDVPKESKLLSNSDFLTLGENWGYSSNTNRSKTFLTYKRRHNSTTKASNRSSEGW